MDPPPTTFTIPRWNLINASIIVNRVADETIIALGVNSGNLKEIFKETAILTAFFGKRSPSMLAVYYTTD